MTIAGYLPLIVSVIGLLIFLVFSRPTTPPSPRSGTFAEVGRIAYAFGLLAFLLTAGAVTESCSSNGAHSSTPALRGDR